MIDNSSLPPFITYSDRSIFIYSVNSNDIGVYDFKIEVLAVDKVVHDSQTFRVTITQSINLEPYWAGTIQD